jgi:hypothetical protein
MQSAKRLYVSMYLCILLVPKSFGLGTHILWKYAHTFFFVVRTVPYEGMHTVGMHHKRTLDSMYTHSRVYMPIRS